MAGNRTRVNCLEGSYAHHYTTIAAQGEGFTAKSALYISVRIQKGEEEEQRRGRGKYTKQRRKECSLTYL